MELDERMKELIAVGASVTANCHPCVKYHVSAALKAGAYPDEIAQAVAVGKLVRGGAARKMDELTISMGHNEGEPAEGCCGKDGCGD